MCAHWCGRVRLKSSKELKGRGKNPLLSAPESYSGWRGFEMGGIKRTAVLTSCPTILSSSVAHVLPVAAQVDNDTIVCKGKGAGGWWQRTAET